MSQSSRIESSEEVRHSHSTSLWNPATLLEDLRLAHASEFAVEDARRLAGATTPGACRLIVSLVDASKPDSFSVWKEEVVDHFPQSALVGVSPHGRELRRESLTLVFWPTLGSRVHR